MKGISVFKQVCLCGLAGFGSFCLAILLLDQWYDNPLKHRMISILGGECSFENTRDIEDVDTLKKIHEVVGITRKLVHEDMMGYRYPNGKYNISATKLEDLVIEENGRPVRSIVLTTWRSGSTFFGDIVNAHPANFYYFEPMMDFEIVKIRGSPLAAYAIDRVKALLNCDYTDQERSIEYGKSHSDVFRYNTYLWKQCQAHREICYDRRFLSKMCKVFPFQSMKIVGLRLSVAQKLFEDESLGIRMVLLVRDPRGTLQSRKHCEWCSPSADCSDPALHCADLVSNYKIAVELLKKYPTTFRVIRYEDLSADPYNQAAELYKFYGRDLHPKVKQYLDTHTTTHVDGMYSTFRNTKNTPFHWRTKLEFQEVEEIQRTCAAAMEHWGYLPAMNATHMMEFDPVTDYVLN